ncbi:glycosyltransferase family A protein, partial [Phytohabitans suffuscus]
HSVLRQDYPFYEIVIIDDFSDDNSFKIIKEFESDKVKIFRNEKNFGTGYTKRRCIEESSGEIFCFLDSDDELASHALSSMVKCHLEDPECSLVFSNYYDCNSDLKIIKKNVRQNAGSSFSHLDTGKISHLVTCKRIFYDRTAGINPAFKLAQDHDLYYKMEEVGVVKYIN